VEPEQGNDVQSLQRGDVRIDVPTPSPRRADAGTGLVRLVMRERVRAVHR
jgi:hypothetical protein